MCGFLALFGDISDSARAAISSAADAINHRGGDQTGSIDRQFFCAVTKRLAILDIGGGRQPMLTADGRFVIAFNGEIYNHRELRAQLSDQGIVFRTHSDTEVVLQLLAHWGADALDRLDGQFAFAFYDDIERELIVARDRYGIAPLFHVALADGGHAFASEVKAFRGLPGASWQIDPNAVNQVAYCWSNLPPTTAFRGVAELPSGHFLRMAAKTGQIPPARRYTNLAVKSTKPVFADIADAIAGSRDLLADEVAKHLVADVPVGAYLSGGIDSTVLVHLAAKAAPGRLKTFSVTFDDHDLDESAAQAEVVQALDLDHISIRVSRDDIAANLPHAVWHAEKPFFRTAPVPLFLLSRTCREAGLKVVLTGEGSDEVFFGYDTYRELIIRRLWARNPESQFRPALLQKIFPYFKHFADPRSFQFLKAFYRKTLEDTANPLYPMLPRLSNGAAILPYLADGLQLSEDALAKSLRDSLPPMNDDISPLRRCQLIELQTLLPGYLLSSQGDRMLMAHGVEGRFPFLGNRLVESLWSLPDGWKIRGMRDKYLLREAFRGLIPESIRQRPKFAYRAPEISAFFPDPPSYVRDLLGRDRLIEAGLFNPDKVAALMKKLDSSTSPAMTTPKDSMAFVWILTSQILHALYIKGVSPDDMV